MSFLRLCLSESWENSHEIHFEVSVTRSRLIERKNYEDITKFLSFTDCVFLKGAKPS